LDDSEKSGPSYNTAFTHRGIRPSVRKLQLLGVHSADNPAPAKSDDPPYGLKPVRVRECLNVIRNNLDKIVLDKRAQAEKGQKLRDENSTIKEELQSFLKQIKIQIYP
jgi:hypothetical protein